MSDKTDRIVEELGYKKPITMPPQTPSEVQIRDTFQTPRYATELLLPFIPKHVTHIWECAAGEGRICSVLDPHYIVYRSDIRGDGILTYNHNFVTDTIILGYEFSWAIITNPPFSIKDLFIEKAFEYGKPFAFLINADYSGKSIEWIKRGCEKIIPTSRIAFLTPHIVRRVNEGEGSKYISIDEIPNELLYRYSSAQFHSMWLTYGFNIGRTETFVDLTVQQRKENIK